MASTLESLLEPVGAAPSLVLLQYDLSAPCVSVLRQIVRDALANQTHVIFASLFLSPHKYLGTLDSPLLHLWERTGFVPGYSEETLDVLAELRDEIHSVGNRHITLVIDSPDTLLSNLGSQSRTLDTLARIFGELVQQSSSSRLVLPIRSNSLLLAPLLSTTLRARVSGVDASSQPSPPHTLTHFIFHPTVLFTHLVQHYHISLPLPNNPPDGSSSRFWSVFVPVAGRGTGEQIIMGSNPDQFNTTPGLDESTSRSSSAGVVEIVTRARSGGQKGVRRVLRGWRMDKNKDRVLWCGWDDIPSLKSRVAADKEPAAPVPTGIDSISFNLQLSDAQQQARANVPLPYVNDGLQAYGTSQDGEIHYIPDQADDFDDDDPDDDLYI